MELTVKQLAERLLPASPDGDLAGLTRQLRHWTLAGILEPTGAVHTGAGKSRKYAEGEIYFAALALELARWRIPIGVSDLIVRMARHQSKYESGSAERRRGFAGAVAGQKNIFLCVKFLSGIGAPEVEIRSGHYDALMEIIREQKWTDDAPSFLAINLTTLFASIGN